MNRMLAFLIGLSLASSLLAQRQVTYIGTNITGQLQLVRTVNALEKAQPGPALLGARSFLKKVPVSPEFKKPSPRLRPEVFSMRKFSLFAPQSLSTTQSMVVTPGAGSIGFAGLTHRDQRLASNGDQFSVEPPNQSIAVANGYVLEGVNNAFQVYNATGTPLLPKVLSTNELFGLPPAIDRNTGINGPFPTDMRVFFDQTLNKWFVLQRAQDYDIFGNPLNSSRLYMAVSQTSIPTGTYNIYTIDTTNS